MEIAPHRAQLPARACPVCGAAVEPLRARAVLLLEDGERFLCSPACRDRFLEGERFRARSEPPPRASASRSGSSTDPVLRAIRKKRPSQRPSGSTSSSEWTAPHAAAPEPPIPIPVLPLSVAGIAILAAPLVSSWTLAGIVAILVAAAAALSLIDAKPLAAERPRGVERTRAGSRAAGPLGAPVPRLREAGWLALAAAPIGALVAAGSGLAALADGSDPRLLLAGAALASAAAILRVWIDARASRPVARAMEALEARLPARARVPIDDAARPLRLEAREVEIERLRAGEEVIAGEGEVLAVDGVVRAGEAYVLSHPAARAPVRRRAGDPVIAGARVVDGAIRVLASRVGADRALVRAARFGDGSAEDAARITRLVARAVPFAGILVASFAVLALLLGGGAGGLATRLAAVAGVLLAIPLLSLRRAAELPFVAAGATAAERGIAFQSARALDRAGAVDIVALCTHGTITEGEPEVVEVHLCGQGRDEDAVALAAGAEAASDGHPIARALVRHAERQRIANAPVRRVTTVPGRGVTAVGAGGESIVVGSRQHLLDEGVSVAALDDEATRAEQRGLSVVFVGVDRRPRALFALRDEDRPGARAAVQRLIDLSLEVLLLSGDHRGTVEALARTLDVAHVKAELSPSERGDEVRRLREGGSVVAVIGRPQHDDQALAAADVPVVLASAGGPDGERAVALSTDDVRDAAAALWLASAARREAQRAVVIAAIAGLALAALAANGLIAPGLVALGALAIDAWSLPAAARLLRRIELRLPARG